MSLPFEIKNLYGDCIVFTGNLGTGGYGYIRSGKGRLAAHRLAYQLANPLTFKHHLMVLHHCDNPKCINPKHLYQGTALSNAIDRQEHGDLAKKKIPIAEGIFQLLKRTEEFYVE